MAVRAIYIGHLTVSKRAFIVLKPILPSQGARISFVCVMRLEYALYGPVRLRKRGGGACQDLTRPYCAKCRICPIRLLLPNWVKPTVKGLNLYYINSKNYKIKDTSKVIKNRKIKGVIIF